MSAARAFFDTNVLLYLYSRADPAKQKRARELYELHALSGAILVSTQVIQEFYAAATRKLGLTQTTARDLTESLFDLPLVIVNPSHIRAAIDNQLRRQISFWDGLIVAAAEAGGAEVLYTEDLNDGQQYGSVRVRNPFRPNPGP
jgi:predicted nucleic acid-binding protein